MIAWRKEAKKNVLGGDVYVEFNHGENSSEAAGVFRVGDEGLSWESEGYGCWLLSLG